MRGLLSRCSAQVLRYTLYSKERSTFVDASFLRNDWWQKVRDLWTPPRAKKEGEEDEEEEEDIEGGQECEEGEVLLIFSSAPADMLTIGLQTPHNPEHRLFSPHKDAIAEQV